MEDEHLHWQEVNYVGSQWKAKIVLKAIYKKKGQNGSS